MRVSSCGRQISCHLLLDGDSPHIRQVVTGFYELPAAGIIDLAVSGQAGAPDEWLHPLTLRAVIAGRRAIYDANDGWYVAPELQPYLPSADYYSKRSMVDRPASPRGSTCISASSTSGPQLSGHQSTQSVAQRHASVASRPFAARGRQTSQCARKQARRPGRTGSHHQRIRSPSDRAVRPSGPFHVPRMGERST